MGAAICNMMCTHCACSISHSNQIALACMVPVCCLNSVFVLLVKLHCFVDILSRHDPESHARPCVLDDTIIKFRFVNNIKFYRKQHGIVQNVSVPYRND